MLGRKVIIDERDHNYLLKDHLPAPSNLQYRYWDSTQWWGNQGQSNSCVGFAFAHLIEDGPVYHNGTPPVISPYTIYAEAQKIDEWPGEEPAVQGTSVRAAAQYLLNTGKISSYTWAWDIDTLIEAVLTKGPVIAGTVWTENMFYPNAEGYITPAGNIVGGHCYVINGVSRIYKRFRIKNSWSQTWGLQGHAFISFDNMAHLIAQAGEICLPIECTF